MGALSASMIESWLLVMNDVKLRNQKHVENDVEEKVVRGFIEEADHFVIVQRRHFVGLIHFEDATGDTSTSFRWYGGGGRTLGWSKVGRINPSDKYVCTNDKLEMEDYIIGSGWQEQVWELQSKWKPVAGSYYEEAVED